MSTSTQRRTTAASATQDQRSRAAGRAAGYCWSRNPNGPGRCTWPPHTLGGHKDHYAHTECW
ncbi:hypothetical protein ABIE67_004541 [Streptomyces sp. V4I8]|uniref:hypothetical protein n=1 Tax=Streptomyces sp. V4I8 TaxID=3156469 RepID=UPI003516F3F1